MDNNTVEYLLNSLMYIKVSVSIYSYVLGVSITCICVPVHLCLHNIQGCCPIAIRLCFPL